MDKLIHLRFNLYRTSSGIKLRKIKDSEGVVWVNPDNPAVKYSTPEEAQGFDFEEHIFSNRI
jgi:hypothetical protein